MRAGAAQTVTLVAKVCHIGGPRGAPEEAGPNRGGPQGDARGPGLAASARDGGVYSGDGEEAGGEEASGEESIAGRRRAWRTWSLYSGEEPSGEDSRPMKRRGAGTSRGLEHGRRG